MRALALILFLSVILGQDEDIDLDTVNLDLDALWENTVWEEIQDVTDVYYEVEQVTPVAGVRGAEAEDEALEHLYYRRSMKRLSKLDLEKAYGKLIIKRDQLLKNNMETEKVDKFIIVLEKKIKQQTS